MIIVWSQLRMLASLIHLDGASCDMLNKTAPQLIRVCSLRTAGLKRQLSQLQRIREGSSHKQILCQSCMVFLFVLFYRFLLLFVFLGGGGVLAT